MGGICITIFVFTYPQTAHLNIENNTCLLLLRFYVLCVLKYDALPLTEHSIAKENVRRLSELQLYNAAVNNENTRTCQRL